MSRNQGQTSAGEELTPARAFNLFFLFLAGYAACFWPFTRSRFGVRAFGIPGVAALVVMYLYATFYPCGEMIYFFPVWLVLVICHRVDSLRNEARGQGVHSRYDGYSYLFMSIGVRDENFAKGVCEPLLLFAIGGYLYTSGSQAIGDFIFCGGVALFLKRAIECGLEAARVREMRDQAFEMRARAARFRNRRY